MRRRTLPNDFVAEVPCAEDAESSTHFEVVAGGGVAVEVEAAAGFEDAVELDEAGGHHDQVGGHLVAAEEARPVKIPDERGNQVDKAFVGAGHEVGVEVFGAAAPVPAVLEGGDLGVAVAAGFVAEEDVVAAVGVEGRVEVDEVDGGVGEVVGVAQDGEVVAVEEGVGVRSCRIGLGLFEDADVPIAPEVLRSHVVQRADVDQSRTTSMVASDVGVMDLFASALCNCRSSSMQQFIAHSRVFRPRFRKSLGKRLDNAAVRRPQYPAAVPVL